MELFSQMEQKISLLEHLSNAPKLMDGTWTWLP
jgi:hypothetical protein